MDTKQIQFEYLKYFIAYPSSQILDFSDVSCGGKEGTYPDLSQCFPDKLRGVGREREVKVKSIILSPHCRKYTQKQIEILHKNHVIFLEQRLSPFRADSTFTWYFRSQAFHLAGAKCVLCDLFCFSLPSIQESYNRSLPCSHLSQFFVASASEDMQNNCLISMQCYFIKMKIIVTPAPLSLSHSFSE